MFASSMTYVCLRTGEATPPCVTRLGGVADLDMHDAAVQHEKAADLATHSPGIG